MAKKRAGWERKLYVGTAGSTAATLVETATDVGLGKPKTFFETTTRGDGTSVPKKTEQVTQLAAEPTFTFLYKDSDAVQATIFAAEEAGTPLAIKIEAYASGETEFDGDCYLEITASADMTGGRPVEVTCHPTDDAGRSWTY